MWFLYLFEKAGPILQEAAIVLHTHQQAVRLASALTALFCALSFLLPKGGDGLAGRWSKYTGWAFLTFFIQYITRYASGFVETPTGPVHLTWVATTGKEIVVFICSIINNLLFLAAARILLNKGRNFQRVQIPRKEDNLYIWLKAKITSGIVGLRAALPDWALAASLVGLIAPFHDVRMPYFLWARFPDALFSLWCLGHFGYALAVNFNFRRRSILPILALLIASLYGLGQVAHAATPYLTYFADEVSRTGINETPATNLKERVGVVIYNLTSNLPQEIGKNLKRNDFLDLGIYAALLPLKFLLFLPAFYLYMLFIMSANDFRKVLVETNNKRRDYLSEDGVLSSIGRALSASLVELFVRIPGVQQELVFPLRWEGNSNNKASQEFKSGNPPDFITPSPLSEYPLLMRIMKETGDPIILTPRDISSKAVKPHLRDFVDGYQIMAPIKFHGGVVGVLNIYLRKSNYSYAALQQIRLMAELVAPSVQDFRILAALDQIGFRLTRLQVDYPTVTHDKAAELIVDILQDVLSPLATGLFIECGFNSIKEVQAQDRDLERLLEEQVVRYEKQDQTTYITRTDTGAVRIEKNQLMVRTEKSEKSYIYPLGNLMVSIPHDKDNFAHPTLAAYYLNRRAVASLAADGVLDSARVFFSSVIKDLSVVLSKETLNSDEWFEAIDEKAKHAGLLWTVATQSENHRVWGSPEAAKIIESLSPEERDTLSETELGSVVIKPPCPPTYHVIRLDLPRSKRQLYLGVERRSFGQELEFPSPWRSFLEDLAEIADTSLASIQDRHKGEAERIRAAQTQGIMSIAVTTGTLMHQLINMLRAQISATEELEEAYKAKEIVLDENSAGLLVAMKDSAKQMQNLTSTFKNVTKMDEKRPCSLREAAVEAASLFKISLTQKRIGLDIKVAPDVEPDVYFHVAAFALANLIGNAAEAIGLNGKIIVESEDRGSEILCRVTDNGPGIDPEIQKKIFELGESKKDGHNGWGLYFTDRALTENGGSIEIGHSDATGTSFILKFPKQRTS